MNLAHRLDKLELERGKTDPLKELGGFHDPRFTELIMHTPEEIAGPAMQREYPKFCQFFRDLLRKPPKPDSAPDTPVLSRNETG